MTCKIVNHVIAMWLKETYLVLISVIRIPLKKSKC